MANDDLLLSNISEQKRNEALERYRLLQPHLEGGIPLARVGRVHGIPERTLRRWLHQFRTHGLVGLARKERADRGSRKGLNQTLLLVIEGLALRTPPPTVAFVHRQAVFLAQQNGWAPPSYSLVYDLIRDMDPALVSLAHEGTKGYKEAFDLIHRREASRPNEMWQADHTQLDIWIRGDGGKPTKPWLTVILDDYSRAVAGYFLSFQAPSALNTSLALRQAIWRKDDHRWRVCGIPDTFYTDHGSDFTSRHMEQVAADIKMSLVFSLQGQPRGRGKIERFFESVNQLFLCALPGYSPAGNPPSEASLTLAELDRLFQKFLLDEYHPRVHGGTNVPPQDRWENGSFLPRLPDSLEHLDLLLLTVAKSRRVLKDGIHFQGLRYIDLTLAAYIGEDVTIRFDPRDMAEIRVYHCEKFLCRAVCQELAGQTIGIKEITQVRNQRRKQLRQGLTERSALVERLLSVHQLEPGSPEAQPPVQEPVNPEKRLRRYYHDE